MKNQSTHGTKLALWLVPILLVFGTLLAKGVQEKNILKVKSFMAINAHQDEPADSNDEEKAPEEISDDDSEEEPDL